MRWTCFKDVPINRNWNCIRMRHRYFDAFHNLYGIRFLHFNGIWLFNGVRNTFLNNLMFDLVDWHWKATNKIVLISHRLFVFCLIFHLRSAGRKLHELDMVVVCGNEYQEYRSKTFNFNKKKCKQNHSHWHIHVGRFEDRNRWWDVNGHFLVDWHRYRSIINWMCCRNISIFQWIAIISKTGICVGQWTYRYQNQCFLKILKKKTMKLIDSLTIPYWISLTNSIVSISLENWWEDLFAITSTWTMNSYRHHACLLYQK